MQIIASPISRRERERLARRRAILDAAEDVFAERNFSRATIEEVAHRAEFGKGTIYNYFPGGKEEILRSIFDRLYDDLCRHITESFTAESRNSFRSQLKNFVGGALHFFLDRKNLFLILVKESQRLSLSDDEQRADYFKRQHARALDTLAVPLELAMDRGEIKRLPPRLLAHMLFVNLKGGQLRQCIHRPDNPGSELNLSADDLAAFFGQHDHGWRGNTRPKIDLVDPVLIISHETKQPTIQNADRVACGNPSKCPGGHFSYDLSGPAGSDWNRTGTGLGQPRPAGDHAR